MKNLITYIFILVVTFSYGQELNLPVWTQYLADNDFVISPTYAGIGDNLRIRANGLTQWVGIKDAPDNQSLYADFRISNRSGVGLSAYNDKNGNTRQKGVKFSFAHHLVIDYYTKQYLSFGISYNINNFKIDIQNFQPTYEIPIVDPSITDDRSISNNNFDIGALYRYGGYYLSLNANNILKKDIDQFGSYDDYFWVGASYRFLNDQTFKPLNLGPMAGVMKSKFYFAYSYQITMNDLAGYNSGTHMITVGIDFLQGISDCPCTKGTNKM